MMDSTSEMLKRQHAMVNKKANQAGSTAETFEKLCSKLPITKEEAAIMASDLALSGRALWQRLRQKRDER
jgi:hypothetical protein